MTTKTQRNLEECLRDFFAKHEWESAREVFAQATHVNEGTVRRWYNGDMMPRGYPLVCVHVAMDALGYRSIEFSRLPHVMQQFARMLTLELMTVKGAMEVLEYKSSSAIYRPILEGTSLMPDKIYRLEKLVESHSDTIDELFEEYARKLQAIPKVSHAPLFSKEEEFEVIKSRTEMNPEVTQLETSSTLVEDEVVVQAIALTLQSVAAYRSLMNDRRLWKYVRFAVGNDTIQALQAMLIDISEA